MKYALGLLAIALNARGSTRNQTTSNQFLTFLEMLEW